MKKFLAIALTAFLLISALPFAASAADAEYTVNVINQDGNYTIDCDQNDPVDIDGVTATVTLSNASIQNWNRSAIVVKGNSNVTFVLEGFSSIKGSDNVCSCGIEVEYGSSVTFEGEGTLNVTGGKYGAGIGSWGTVRNIPYEERSLVGEIVINSGYINAYGGDRGAGIGSGYHVNGNRITINGGVIHAYGRGCGSGIGTGYGTSGGSDVEGAGGYDAGTIIINGGEVYAATKWNQDFSFAADVTAIDYAALNADAPGSYAAGIGGGYGACVSLVEINGGKVVAIGSCGGAGIGGGRGASSYSNYKDINDEHSYKVTVKIGGDADVTAVTASPRSTEIDGGAAAIGGGRGTHDVGDIEITGNANVKAISASKSPAIGISTTEKWPMKKATPPVLTMPHTNSIVIGDSVTLYAVSMGDYAVDKDAHSLSISDEYFGSSDRYFFGEAATAISDVSNVKAESTKGEKTYVVPANSVSLWANIVPTTPVSPEPKTSLNIVAPLAMALRFEDGSVYYSGDSVENLELNTDYRFQMCCVDWSTRDRNGEKKIHRPYETFYPASTASQHVNHGIYSDEGVGLAGTVVYTVRISDQAKRSSYDEDTRTFILSKSDRVLRTDVNKCFMAYRFWFQGSQYNKQTGIDNVVYDTGIEHENTLEDFQYNKPLESLSVNLPLGSTITAKAYKNYEYVGQADILITIDEEHPERCYKDYYWEF